MKPLARMWDRVEVGRQDSNTALFNDLMYLGEMASKIAVATLVAGIGEDKARYRYRHTASLVRADGVGEWARVLDEILVGPAAQHLYAELRTEQRELTQKCAAGTWQFTAVDEMHRCLKELDPECEPLPTKVDGKRWLREFAWLRNKTRGHGAPRSELLSTLCPHLEVSLRAFLQHSAFQREWAYVHRNLSGKYRVTRLSDTDVGFEFLRQGPRVGSEHLVNGVYVALGRPFRVELAASNVDASEFFLANGGFNDKRFEMISYASGQTTFVDSGPYLNPTTPLPASETQGLGDLECVGHSFSNVPALPGDYVRREGLELELLESLRNDRHPVVTLLGRGGIGKTSLALAAAHEMAQENRFEAIIWFSARDLDLLPEGPKPVRAAVLNIDDVAQEYVRLVMPQEASEKGFKSVEYFAATLTKSTVGATLFVFDNFETVASPSELFRWLDTYIRLPNKILITTRHRDFRGDYHIDVRGMTEFECERLVDSVAGRRGLLGMLTREYRDELFRESEGHPYVVKILLGEVAKAGRVRKVERIVAEADEILTALFERTYGTLSPGAQRVFLTLCNWRSTVPKMALEAVLLRPANERMPVSEAIDELERSSFVELLRSDADNEIFISTPLVASMFGRRKLAASPMKAAIEVDTDILRLFGPAQRADIRQGVVPRLQRLVATIATKVEDDPKALEQHLPLLEFIARHHPAVWLDIAELYEESDELENAKVAVRRHLESATPQQALASWRRLADLCRQTGDFVGEVHALVEASQLPGLPAHELSSAANRINSLLVEHRGVLDSEEKRILIRRIADALEARANEADASACSRLAWLYLHLSDDHRAAVHTKRGLRMDGNNEHCLRLADRLGISV